MELDLEDELRRCMMELDDSMEEGRFYGDGFFVNEFHEMKEYPARFKRYTRMYLSSFEYLLDLLEPEITPQTSRPTDICAEQRLAITIRYLATGDQISSIAQVYKVGESTLSRIIKHTCAAISRVLCPRYLRFPTEPIWHNISKGYHQRWNLPHCLGAVDCKHIHIEAPPHSGSLFYNYKKTYSIVMMAACNHRYEFTRANIGSFGGESDGGVFSRSAFGRHLIAETLPIPRNYTNLPGSNIKAPYYFIGDDAFALRTDFMKPYSDRNLTQEQQIFNYRISRARNCIECAFGILVRRWQVLKGRIAIHPNAVDNIVLACVCLHNFVMSRTQAQERTCDDAQQGRQVVVEHEPNVAPAAVQLRHDLTRYFMSQEGQVPWQLDYVNRGRNQED
ncbi:uncharacterized protein LOC131675521 [Phymastichus coffea]|uniref:uncharacterized protein LOC131675521 n=1 Tax=Phymastichus coffea TaxID=108790 RepID=UPI00273C8E2A|nr:uncharacterized protein LOC131675521 [Phymastichus coffea]